MENRKSAEQIYVELNLKLKDCVDKLELLRKEKKMILNLADSENPPADILEIMDKNVKDYEKLLEVSEQIKNEIKKFVSTIK